MRVVSPVSAALGLGVAMLACSALLLLASGSRAVAASTARPGPVLTFYFGLKRPEAKAVAAFWAVQQPESATYRQFLTPAEIAWRYGASSATRSAFVAAISHLGLRASIDPSGVFARVQGTTAQLERAFKVRSRAFPTRRRPFIRRTVRCGYQAPSGHWCARLLERSNGQRSLSKRRPSG